MPMPDAPIAGKELVLNPHPVEAMATLLRDAKRQVDRIERELSEAKGNYAAAHEEYRQYVSKLAGIPL